MVSQTQHGEMRFVHPERPDLPPWMESVVDMLEAKAEAIDHAVTVASRLDGMFETRRELHDCLYTFLDLMRVESANLRKEADGMTGKK